MSHKESIITVQNGCQILNPVQQPDPVPAADAQVALRGLPEGADPGGAGGAASRLHPPQPGGHPPGRVRRVCPGRRQVS